MDQPAVIANSSGAQVRLRNLSKVFGTVVAVDGVSLDVPAGAFVSLLGPSGSGKTTTLFVEIFGDARTEMAPLSILPWNLVGGR